MDFASLLSALTRSYRSVRALAIAHKVWAGLIALVVLYGGYQAYGALTAAPTATRYVTTTVATGTVVASMSETGQVSASHQLTLSPKASGQVVAVYVTPGEQVYAGQAIAQLDASDALQSLANAKLSLQNQQITYAQATASSTLALSLLQAQNGATNAGTSLQKTHDASYASLASVYTDLSSVTSDLDSVLHDYNVPGRSTQQNLQAFADTVSTNDSSISIYSNSAQTSFDAAVAAYNSALAVYKATPYSATDDQLKALADTTYTAAQAVAEAVKDAHDFFDRVKTDYTLYNLQAPSALTNLLGTVGSDTSTITNDLSATLTAKSNLISAEQSLAEAEDALQKAEGGANTLTVQQATLALRQAEQSVASAEQTVADYTVTAPFTGTIASVGVQKYDQASSGTNVATLVAHQQNVDISVNEVDAAKLKVGQKASITFDALPDLTIAGTVASVDTIGTVSQGVVSYDAVIEFDTPNDQVKPGMSATVEIITDTASGLVVPSSAVKTAGGASYVQVFNPPLSGSDTPPGVISAAAPTRVPVTTGLSGDTDTIITGGLSAGEQVVVSSSGVSSSAAKSTAAQSTSVFGGGGATRSASFGGGARGGGAVLLSR